MKNRKSLLLVAVTAFVVTLAGCVPAREHERQVGALQNRLENEKHALNAARMELQDLREAYQARTNELETVRRRAAELGELSERLEQAKAERERNLREMQDLVRDISGMSIQHRAEGDFIVIENEILFDPGKIELKEEARNTIRGAVIPYIKDQLAVNEDKLIRIDGHSDGQPIRVSPWDDNHHLSVMRAHSVLVYLTEEGIPRKNMFLAGFGPNRPILEPPSPEAGVPENRRVEILLVPHRDDDIQRILEEFVQ